MQKPGDTPAYSPDMVVDDDDGSIQWKSAQAEIECLERGP